MLSRPSKRVLRNASYTTVAPRANSSSLPHDRFLRERKPFRSGPLSQRWKKVHCVHRQFGCTGHALYNFHKCECGGGVFVFENGSRAELRGLGCDGKVRFSHRFGQASASTLRMGRGYIYSTGHPNPLPHYQIMWRVHFYSLRRTVR